MTECPSQPPQLSYPTVSLEAHPSYCVGGFSFWNQLRGKWEEREMWEAVGSQGKGTGKNGKTGKAARRPLGVRSTQSFAIPKSKLVRSWGEQEKGRGRPTKPLGSEGLEFC